MTTEPTPAPFGVFSDAETGVVIVRELTAEEIAAIPTIPSKEELNETPSPS
jgi:hypothetical protein